MDMDLHTHEQEPVTGMYQFVTTMLSFNVHWMAYRFPAVT
jgi:hypothetical protein